MITAAVEPGGIRVIPIRAWLIAAAVALPLAAIKVWVGGHMLQSGPNFNSNGAWLHRYLTQIDGFDLGYFTTLSWPTALLGLSLAVIIVYANRLGLIRTIASIIAAAAVSALAQSILLHTRPDVRGCYALFAQ